MLLLLHKGEHMLRNRYKVIFKGSNIAKDEQLRVVKKGNYTVDSDGIVSALESGLFDKYGYNSNVPLFVPAFIVPKVSKRADTQTFSVILKKIDHNGKDLLAVYLVDVQFRDLQYVQCVQEE